MSLLFRLGIVVTALAHVASFRTQFGGHVCGWVPFSSPEEREGRILVLVPGFAQSLSSWEAHAQYFCSKLNRNVLVVQPQGMGTDFDGETNDVSLARQAMCLWEAVDDATCRNSVVDLAGFSLGGRIAMAAASAQPLRVRRMHLTGVGHARNEFGRVQLAAWKDLLQQDNSDLRAIGWSAMLACYSAKFLDRKRDKLQAWASRLTNEHTAGGLRAILEQAHPDSAENPYSVQQMAKKLRGNVHGRLCVGEIDRMAPVDRVRALAEALAWDVPTVVPHAGHAVHDESPSSWRRHVLTYLQD